mgnify:CR=1 FL=1
MMRRKVFLLVVVVLVMLTGCSNKISFNTIAADIEELSVEPENWQSEEAICLYDETKLPPSIQREYIRIVQSENDKKICLAGPKGGTMDILSDEEGIYIKNQIKFFRSGNSIVLISKSWRTMNRQEYTEEAELISSQIEIDIPDQAEYVKVAETQNFSVVYNTKKNQYVCLKYGEVIGAVTATNLEALLHAEMPKGKEESDDQVGFNYNGKEYVLIIDKNNGNMTFNVAEKKNFSESYNKEDILVNGNIVLKACVIVR